jgi:hypothetical protein
VRLSFPAGSKPRKTRRVERMARHLALYHILVFETELLASDERPDNTKQQRGNGKGITIPQWGTESQKFVQTRWKFLTGD